jgi:hypothetical protein
MGYAGDVAARVLGRDMQLSSLSVRAANVHEMLTFRGVSPTNTHARGEEVPGEL